MSDEVDIRLGILGCGPATEQLYLPMLRNLHGIRTTLLIDSDTNRREYLASKFHVAHSHSDVDQCYSLFDAAIVALPPLLRQPACLKLLTQRKAVLVEQPMALSVAESDAVICAAKQADTLLAVAQPRQFLWAHRLTHFLVKSAAWGRVESFDFRNGFIQGSPATSDRSFNKESAGSGVLVDAGFHTLSCLLHWLGDFSEVEYFDDAAGGVEANALLNLRLQNGPSGIVELSSTRRLRNTAIIRCERGIIEIGLDTNNAKLTFSDHPYAFVGQVSNLNEPGEEQDDLGLAGAQVDDFIAAIRNDRKAEVTAQSDESTIRLIESCYRYRKPLQFSWAYQDKIGTA